jgi:bacillithiol biosynthesis cysteine-adding enzyme BshC
MTTLFEAYCAGDDAVLRFYAGAPDQARQAPQGDATWAQSLVEAVNVYQEHLGCSGRVHGSEHVIITGQQPAVFTGPLYTVYKAITAIKLAAHLEEAHGTRCVPIFWVASEDHDFDEARTTYALTKAHRLLPVSYEPEADLTGHSMNGVPLEQSLHEFADLLAEETPGSEFRDEIRTHLHESLDAADSLSDWAARLMARLFRDTPLVIFSPHLPEARNLTAPIIERAIEQPLAVTAALNAAGNRLSELGYPPQLVKAEKECAFFVYVGERRCKVVFENDRYRLPEVGRTYSENEILSLLHEAPERFSPNAALRCVVQQSLFPVHAYVGGPGEIAYWGQLKEVFGLLNQPMPIIYPRARALLTTTKLNKLRKKLDLNPSDLVHGPEAVLDAVLRRVTKSAGHEQIGESRETVLGPLRELADALQPLDATAYNMTQNLAERVADELGRVERAMLRSDGQQVDAVRSQVERLCNALMPERKPQERVLSIWSYLFEYGWSLVDRLNRELDPDRFDVQEIEL